jgi:arabinose-5-phosphate isomerase
VVLIEAEAIKALARRFDDTFVASCQCLLQTTGRIIVMGVGKSGHIARKVAATLASTGSPSFYVHPAEASHGDTGMITSQDAVVIISYSGETPELLVLLPALKHLAVPIVALTGAPQSTLAAYAKYHLDISVEREACPLGLAPTSSTAAALAMGDALALSLLELRGFTAEGFAFAHPGGSLGRQLLKVADLMSQNDEVPVVPLHTNISDALWEMTRKSLGMTTVVDAKHHLLGIYTDGDLRRTLDQKLDLQTTLIDEVMHTHPKTTTADALASQALHIMEAFKITSLVVLNQDEQVVGVIHIHHLLRAGVR